MLYITFENSLLKFPSLTGVIRFLMKKNYSYNIYDAVSVPYRGYSFFNWIFQNLRTLILTSKVSVPYRGYSFFNYIRRNGKYFIFKMFPSLTGVIRFLIAGGWCIDIADVVSMCFRPLQGLFVF